MKIVLLFLFLLINNLFIYTKKINGDFVEKEN